ncbi:MAG: hypothetical protein ACLUVD_05975 [Mediterraneibacter faecis]
MREKRFLPVSAVSGTFQICNHNYLLADGYHRLQDYRPLLKDYRALIVDEAF